MKPGGFNISLFFCDIVSPPEDESEMGLQLQPSDKLEDLQKRVRAKELKKRTLARQAMAFFVSIAYLFTFSSWLFFTLSILSAVFRLNLCLGEGINVAVGIYATAVAARKPGSIKLYRETNEPVRSKTRTFHTQTGSLLLPSEIKKAQVMKISWSQSKAVLCLFHYLSAFYFLFF